MTRILLTAIVLALGSLDSLSVSPRAQTLNEATEWMRDFLKEEANVAAGDWRDQYRLVANSCNVTIFHDTLDISCTKPQNKASCDNWPHSTTHNFRQVFNLK